MHRTARRLSTALVATLVATAALVLPTAPAATTAVAAPVPAAVTTAPLAAAAKPARPRVTVVPGADRLTVTWTRTPGAKRYVVEVSTSKKFTKRTTKKYTVTAPTRTKAVTRLKLRTDYRVRVTAVTPSAKVRSTQVRTRLDSRATGRLKITVKPAGANKVKVSWPRVPRGTKITLRASWDDKTLAKKATRWTAARNIAPTTRSKVVAVPKKYRAYVGAATGNPVYVQAIFHNGSKKKNTSRAAYGRAVATTKPAITADALTVAAYNVGSISATKSSRFAGYRWADRRASAANAIARANPDVVAVQEATTAKHTNGVRHYQDLLDVLSTKRSGYALAYDAATIGTAGGSGVTKGDHIYVRTQRVQVLSSGVQSVSALLARGDRISKDRHFGWAHLRDRRTGETFWVASVHLQSNSRASSSHRVAAITAIDAFLTRRASAGEAVMLMGDFNADVARDRAGASTQAVRLGYTDAASAPVTEGHRWATTNNQNGNPKGYPATPYSYAYGPTRIDYVFVRGAKVLSHTNQVVLRKGRFVESYRGSDHNLQRAQVLL